MLTKSEKMDMAGARTPADIERKYNFGKSFAEISGIATDARTTAAKAEQTAENVESDLKDLFAKDIVMEGTFTYTVETFLYPEEPELEALRQAFQMYEEIPYTQLWDFNGDGVVNGADVNICHRAVLGMEDLSNWKYAVKKPVTMTIDLSNPDKAIKFTGVNMWGREIASYIGVNFSTMRNRVTEQRLYDLELRIAALEAK